MRERLKRIRQADLYSKTGTWAAADISLLGKDISILDIQKAVAVCCGVETRKLRLPVCAKGFRVRKFARARMMAIYLARKITRVSRLQIGREFGGCGNTYVACAERKIEQMLKQAREQERAIRIKSPLLRQYERVARTLQRRLVPKPIIEPIAETVPEALIKRDALMQTQLDPEITAPAVAVAEDVPPPETSNIDAAPLRPTVVPISFVVALIARDPPDVGEISAIKCGKSVSPLQQVVIYIASSMGKKNQDIVAYFGLPTVKTVADAIENVKNRATSNQAFAEKIQDYCREISRRVSPNALPVRDVA